MLVAQEVDLGNKQTQNVLLLLRDLVPFEPNFSDAPLMIVKFVFVFSFVDEVKQLFFQCFWFQSKIDYVESCDNLLSQFDLGRMVDDEYPEVLVED